MKLAKEILIENDTHLKMEPAGNNENTTSLLDGLRNDLESQSVYSSPTVS